MGGYVGMIVVGGALILFAALRLMYGSLSSLRSQREEFATYLALLFFAVSFSLTVIRSPEGIARYQEDIDHSVPYTEKYSVMTPDDLSRQLSPQRSKKLQTPSDCATCHAAKRETFAELVVTIAADSNQLNKTFEKILLPLQKTAASHGSTIALLPKEPNNRGLWKQITGWLSPEGRSTRKFETQAQQLTQQKQVLEDKLSEIRKFYDVTKYREETGLNLNRYADAVKTQETARAAYHLLQAADQNSKFHQMLLKGNSERVRAAGSLFILNWGCLLFVAAALGARIMLRKLYPDAEWYIYPGTIFFWGISLVLMTDLGLNYVSKLRFYGYYTWRWIEFCSTVFVVMAMVCKLPVSRNKLAKMLESCRCNTSRTVALLIGLLLTTALAGLFLHIKSGNSSELIKFMAVLFFAWYALARGDYISRRTQLKGSTPQGWLRETFADLFVVSFTVLVTFFTTKDFGPMLIMLMLLSCYVWLLMGSRTLLCILLGWSAILVPTWLLQSKLSKTSMFAHIYRRINEMMSPFYEGSTELAKLVWLRKSAGAFGYGFGEIPYFGHYVKKGTDTIVTSMQIQSDYTPSHLIAQFGYLPGAVLLGVYLAFLLKLLQDASAIAGDSTKQAVGRFVAWFLALSVLLMVIQMFVTVCGNFTLMPLSGVTLPYTSYGGSSLLFATLVSALSYTKERFQ